MLPTPPSDAAAHWHAPVAAAVDAARGELARTAAPGTLAQLALPAIAAAAATLGRASYSAGLGADDLAALVSEVAGEAGDTRSDARGARYVPHADAMLLYVWRAARRAYQDAAGTGRRETT